MAPRDFLHFAAREVPDVEVAAAGGEEDARGSGVEEGGGEGGGFEVEGGEEGVGLFGGRGGGQVV